MKSGRRYISNSKLDFYAKSKSFPAKILAKSAKFCPICMKFIIFAITRLCYFKQWPIFLIPKFFNKLIRPEFIVPFSPSVELRSLNERAKSRSSKEVLNKTTAKCTNNFRFIITTKMTRFYTLYSKFSIGISQHIRVVPVLEIMTVIHPKT